MSKRGRVTGEDGGAGYWRVGDRCRVTRLVEMESGMPRYILPAATRQVALSMPSLRPLWVSDDGRMRMCVQMLVIDLPSGARVAVDTCVGNHKRRTVREWHMRDGPFLSQLVDAGVDPDSVTHVICTHIHDDHVGWNTTWAGDRWVPTFKRARYYFVDQELEYWRQQLSHAATAQRTDQAMQRGGTAAADAMQDMAVMHDSVEPLFAAGVADVVPANCTLLAEAGAEVSLQHTPGHTPGHVCVRLRAGGDEAVISGDCCHHPIQLARPDICSTAVDTDSAQAADTRRALLRQVSASGALFIGTHWVWPTAGRVREHGDGFAVTPVPPTPLTRRGRL
eukprot:TRINITY_DN16480_c0_g1_i2.p1 TRINITY_DN16480_c0_g1~~TRINITY_DN16480_c0_g1_i2.p1  ORF type:complete len:336 (+),score=67.09 TRINITY_DN16480_c0_g1_i2:70-1077(+)